MSNQLDRPARRPRPAADAGVDPIDYRPAATGENKPDAAPPPPAPETPTGRAVSAPVAPERPSAPVTPRTPAAPPVGPAVREQTVQLNSRVSADVAAVLDAAAAGSFPSKRAAIEYAITQTFGS